MSQGCGVWSLPIFCGCGARFQRFNSNETKCKYGLGGANSPVCPGGPRAVVAANHSGSSTGSSAGATARAPPILILYRYPSAMVTPCRGHVKPQLGKLQCGAHVIIERPHPGPITSIGREMCRSRPRLINIWGCFLATRSTALPESGLSLLMRCTSCYVGHLFLLGHFWTRYRYHPSKAAKINVFELHRHRRPDVDLKCQPAMHRSVWIAVLHLAHDDAVDF